MKHAAAIVFLVLGASASAQSTFPKPGASSAQTFAEGSAAGLVASCTEAKRTAQKWGNTHQPFTGGAGLPAAYPEVAYSQCQCEDRSKPAGRDGIPPAKPWWVCAVDVTVRWKSSP